MKHDRRGSWYLLTGFVLGIAMGLFYSWVISPVQYTDAPPYALRADYKDEYRLLVASAYLYNSDLFRARDRIAQLKDSDPAQALKKQAQEARTEGRPSAEIQVLENLANAMTQEITPTLSVGETTPTGFGLENNRNNTLPSTAPYGNEATSQVEVSSTQLTAQGELTATQPMTFALQNSQLICSQDQKKPLIQVEVNDAAGQPVPGVEVVVTWEGGEDHFFTGLQPELGLGYGDFLMTPGVVYSLDLNRGVQRVDDLSVGECVAEDGSRYWGSWFMTFVEP
jgi:hypothetical protein